MLITSPNRCSFDIHHTGFTGGEDDEWLDLLSKKVDAYMYKRLIFDTPKSRLSNKLFFTYNPYLISKNDPFRNDLYGPPHEKRESEQATDKLKKTLETLKPFVTFLDRIHATVLEEHETHQMFQKSVFYEVCFFYTLHKTSEDLLTTMMLGCNDRYLGFLMASINRMRIKYTGKQYMCIIPRGLGKTRCIKLAIAVALITFKNCEILAMAHTKSLICTIKDDIENTLLSTFPPTAYGYYTLKHIDSLILVFKDENGSSNNNSSSSRLKYASACRPASLRGNDPDMGFLDEALCVSKDAYSVLSHMMYRTHTKIGFLSSPIASKTGQLLNIVVDMASKCSGSINLYRLCYFCLDRLHVQYSASHTGCYRKMLAPRYISYDKANKSFEEVLTGAGEEDSYYYENEQGILRPEDLALGERRRMDNDAATRAVFSKAFADRLGNPLTYVKLQDLPPSNGKGYDCYWIYMDPAYHASTQSAVAIVCVRLNKNQATLCFADRKLLSHGDLGRVSSIMEEMYVQCLTTIVGHSRTKCYFFVAIERNSSPDAVRSYYNTWVSRSGHLHHLTERQCEIFHYVDVYHNRNLSYGFNLGMKKKFMFSKVVERLNSDHKMPFRIATTTEHGVYSRDVCTVEHLAREIRNYHYKDRKYTGKMTPETTDDVVTCLCLALYLAVSHLPLADARIANLRTERITNCIPPWIAPNCMCPLQT